MFTLLHNPIIIVAAIAILLAFFAGAIQQRNRDVEDAKKLAQLAADSQAQDTGRLYSNVLIRSGYEIDHDNRVKPRKYPKQRIEEAEKYLKDIGLE